MASFNKVILMGNLTRDPELRYTNGGKAVCDFSIAVNKKQNGEDKVNYFDITCWEKSAENCNKYLSKGSSVMVEGELNQQRWDDRETGAKRSKICVQAHNIQFMSKPQDNNDNQPQAQQSQQEQRYSNQDNPQPQEPVHNNNGSDIPF